MSIVYTKFHIPTIEEIKAYGYKIAEAEVTKELVRLVKEETTLTADDLIEIMDLADKNFDIDHQKDILDAMEWYKNISEKAGLFNDSKFGRSYRSLEIRVTCSKKNFHIDEVVDRHNEKVEESKVKTDAEEQNEIADWLNQKDGHGTRFEVYVSKA